MFVILLPAFKRQLRWLGQGKARAGFNRWRQSDGGAVRVSSVKYGRHGKIGNIADRFNRFALPPLLGHLGFNFINLLERDRALAAVGGDAALEKRGTPRRINTGTRITAAQLAQLIKLPPTHKIILPLALDHLLERLLAVPAFRFRLLTVQICPTRHGVADELGHFGQQTGMVVLRGHVFNSQFLNRSSGWTVRL